jgi:hypothetical protein
MKPSLDPNLVSANQGTSRFVKYVSTNFFKNLSPLTNNQSKNQFSEDFGKYFITISFSSGMASYGTSWQDPSVENPQISSCIKAIFGMIPARPS